VRRMMMLRRAGTLFTAFDKGLERRQALPGRLDSPVSGNERGVRGLGYVYVCVSNQRPSKIASPSRSPAVDCRTRTKRKRKESHRPIQEYFKS
jgi:hypothetical protein